MIEKLKNKFFVWFRRRYEERISLPFGITQFIANVAFIQLNTHEYIDLNPASEYMGMIRVTTADMRPTLTYKYWPKGKEWDEHLPVVSVIVEQRGFQVRETRLNADKSVLTSDWAFVATIDLDPRVAVLKDLFLASAFYPSLRAEWKRPL